LTEVNEGLHSAAQDVRQAVRMNLTRREFLAATAATVALTPFAPMPAVGAKARFRIGACDWSLGKTADVTALEVARQIGLDGVQVSLGTLANDMHLRRPEVQQRYKDAAKQSGLEVLSLAIGELNNIPYKSDPRTIAWVNDSIDVCQAMGCRVILLAFFHNNDLRDDKVGTDVTVRRLEEVAPKAEKAGVILGIESWLSAEDHMRIIDRVGSPAVKVYYDVANSTERGYDIFREIRWLGKQGQICEFHLKENGALLGQGKVDFKKVRAALDDIGYRGPMQIEGAVPPGGKLIESYAANLKFLREIFPRVA
jgi:sugar phosphate isomerase/epimerase